MNLRCAIRLAVSSRARDESGNWGDKSNYFDVETGEPYWISGPHKDGQDSLYATHLKPTVDDDVIEEYWLKIRCLPIPAKQMRQAALADDRL